MGVVGKRLDIDYVISTGDNFYEDGLTGVDDSAFYESFSGIYTADSLKTPWYLGKCCFVLFSEKVHINTLGTNISESSKLQVCLNYNSAFQSMIVQCYYSYTMPLLLEVIRSFLLSLAF